MMKKILSICIPAFLLCLSLFFSLRAYLLYRDNYVTVPIASHQLSQRTQLKKEDLQLVSVPKAFLNEDVCTDENEVLGKFVRLSYSVPKGSLIYKGALEEDIRDLSVSLLKDGEVSYDIYVSEVKINTGNLGVGLNVDLYLTIKTSEKTISDLLVEDCRIVGLYDTQGKLIKAYDTDARVAVVSLAVEKDYVPYINKALMIGTVNVLCKDSGYDSFRRSKLNEEAEVLIYLD